MQICLPWNAISQPEKHTKRLATQHGCLPLLAGRWGHRNWNSVQWGKKYFVLGRLEQPRQNKKLLYWHAKPNKPTKKGPPCICTLWVPIHLSFNSQQWPPLSNVVSLVTTLFEHKEMVFLPIWSWDGRLRNYLCPWMVLGLNRVTWDNFDESLWPLSAGCSSHKSVSNSDQRFPSNIGLAYGFISHSGGGEGVSLPFYLCL